MCTSMLLVALLGVDAGPASQAGQTPAWQDSYTAACQVGRREKKPLAVFIGSGARGWEKIDDQGKLTPSVQRLLAQSYVCVYVDGATERGKRLAEAFALTQGLVLSTRDGEHQAFRHSGRLSSRELEATLHRYANDHVTARAVPVDQRSSYSYNPATTTPAPAAYPAGFGGSGGFGGTGGFGGGRSC
jgi:hypothetical protein